MGQQKPSRSITADYDLRNAGSLKVIVPGSGTYGWPVMLRNGTEVSCSIVPRRWDQDRLRSRIPAIYTTLD